MNQRIGFTAADDEATKPSSSADAGPKTDDINVITSFPPSADAEELARNSFSDKKIRLAFIRKVGAFFPECLNRLLPAPFF